MTAHAPSIFGARLKRARLEKGVGVRQLARRSGIDFRTIYYYEDHSRVPSIEAAALLALALDCSLDWLCALDERGEALAIQRKGCKDEIQPIGCEAMESA